MSLEDARELANRMLEKLDQLSAERVFGTDRKEGTYRRYLYLRRQYHKALYEIWRKEQMKIQWPDGREIQILDGEIKVKTEKSTTSPTLGEMKEMVRFLANKLAEAEPHIALHRRVILPE